jgi:dUTP pyrophosphatase
MSHFPHLPIDVLALVKDPQCLPVYMTHGAAGADLKAYLAEPMILLPGQCATIPTGLRVAIPPGYEIQIRPRSGLARKHQITILNTPGTIDADYRGEIEVILMNHGTLSFIINPGMRIAQMVLAPVLQANFIVTEELPITQRGEGGFGHTG